MDFYFYYHKKKRKYILNCNNSQYIQYFKYIKVKKVCNAIKLLIKL